jgi:hypothetical protein
MEMVLGGPEKTESFFRDFQVTGASVLPVVIAAFCTHTATFLTIEGFRNKSPKTALNFEFLGRRCAGF